MKHHLFTISLLAAGFTAHAQHDFQLKGEIKHAKSTYIYLSYMKNGTHHVDSARIQNNKFILKGKIAATVRKYTKRSKNSEAALLVTRLMSSALQILMVNL